MPTLLLNGEYESKAVFAHTKKAEQMIPHSKTVTISKAGHMPNLENPAEFNRALQGYLADTVQCNRDIRP